LELKKNEENHIEIKKIERVLKQISIDCTNNMDIFSKRNKKKYDNSRICDYMKCKYSCISKDINIKNVYDNKKISKISNIILNHENIEFYINVFIKRIFYYFIVFDFETILKTIKDRNICDSNELIYNVISKIVSERKSIEHKTGGNGFLITNDINIFFVPIRYLNYPDKFYISINNLNKSSSINHKININHILHKADITFNKNKKQFDSMKFIEGIKKNFNILSVDNKREILKTSIRLYHKLSINDNLFSEVLKILDFYKYNLIDNDVYIKTKKILINNFEKNYFFDLSLHKKKKHIIGFILNTYFYVLDRKKNKFDIRENMINTDIFLDDNKFLLFGKLFIDSNNNVILKINKKKIKLDVYDKRLVRKGINCLFINNKKKIFDIHQKLLSLVDETENNKIGKIYNYCQEIIRLFKKIQYIYLVKLKLNIRWIYEITHHN